MQYLRPELVGKGYETSVGGSKVGSGNTASPAPTYFLIWNNADVGSHRELPGAGARAWGGAQGRLVHSLGGGCRMPLLGGAALSSVGPVGILAGQGCSNTLPWSLGHPRWEVGQQEEG